MSLCLGILWKIPAPNGWSCAGGSGRDGASAAAGTALPLCITFGQDGNGAQPRFRFLHAPAQCQPGSLALPCLWSWARRCSEVWGTRRDPVAALGCCRALTGGGVRRDGTRADTVPAVPGGHGHSGYCHGSCDSGECGVDASGLLAAPRAPWKRQNTSRALPGLTSTRQRVVLGAEGPHRSGEPVPAGRAPPVTPRRRGPPSPPCLGDWQSGGGSQDPAWGSHTLAALSSDARGMRAAVRLVRQGKQARGCPCGAVPGRAGPRAGGSGKAELGMLHGSRGPAAPASRSESVAVCTCAAVCAWGSPAEPCHRPCSASVLRHPSSR